MSIFVIFVDFRFEAGRKLLLRCSCQFCSKVYIKELKTGYAYLKLEG
jgi:hypothetical protein